MAAEMMAAAGIEAVPLLAAFQMEQGYATLSSDIR
jgi:hypothetical protein